MLKCLLCFIEQHDDEEISTSPGVSEFVSDAFDSCSINKDDLRKEMEQLVLDKKGGRADPEGNTAPAILHILFITMTTCTM